jgi:hypothetical protein
MVDHADIDHTGLTGVAGITAARKTSDQTTTSTSFADVTGLTFAVSANTNYWVRFFIFFQTSATTEGAQFSVNGPTGTYKIGGFVPVSAVAAGGGTIGHASGAAADTTGLAFNAGPGTTDTIAIIEGVVLVGASGGTLALRVRTETGGANSTTVKTNSVGQITIVS